MADNRISFFTFKKNWELGFQSGSSRTLQQARIESQRYRDSFRRNLQDTTFNADADNSQFRVSNIQEIGRLSSGSIYAFAHAFIIRDLVNNKEWMIIYDLPQFHFTTGAFSGIASYGIGGILNGATSGWTNNYGVSYSFNTASPTAPQIATSLSWRWQETWIVPNNDYATSTWGGSWEYPTYASSYTLDFIRASSFGANVISGDPASSGPNPVSSGGANFDSWWPTNWLTKSDWLYSTHNWESSQSNNLTINAPNFWVFDKVQKNFMMYSMYPHVMGKLRIVGSGELFDTFANGGLANVSDTKQNALIVMDVSLDASTGYFSPSLTQNLRRCSGFRGDGTTRDNAMLLALNGDRVYNNYKNGSDEIFTRKVNVSNGFTTKGFLKPSLILEGGTNLIGASNASAYRGSHLVNKVLEYPDADNPMLWTGCPYFTMWKKNLGGIYGLSVPGLP